LHAGLGLGAIGEHGLHFSKAATVWGPMHAVALISIAGMGDFPALLEAHTPRELSSQELGLRESVANPRLRAILREC